jgi:tetratricopeptide (TPR) repeat protein
MIERVPRKRLKLDEIGAVPPFILKLSYKIPVESSAVQTLKRVKLDHSMFDDIKMESLISELVNKTGLPAHLADQLEVRSMAVGSFNSTPTRINILTTKMTDVFGGKGIRLLYWGRLYLTLEGVSTAMGRISGQKIEPSPKVNLVIPTKLDIQALISDRQYIDAIDRLNERLKADQNDVWAWTEKGNLLRILGKYEKSTTCYRIARALDGKDIAAIDGLTKTNRDRKYHGDFD